MSKRKHISWKTKCAASLLCMLSERDRTWYDDAKNMTEDQFLSLFHFDHNILHETGHKDRDEFWNLIPKPIREHREKTKQDAKIIAKGRRIRKKHLLTPLLVFGEEVVCALPDDHVAVAVERGDSFYRLETRRIQPWMRRRLRSRGFDKILRKKMDGTVVKR